MALSEMRVELPCRLSRGERITVSKKLHTVALFFKCFQFFRKKTHHVFCPLLCLFAVVKSAVIARLWQPAQHGLIMKKLGCSAIQPGVKTGMKMASIELHAG